MSNVGQMQNSALMHRSSRFPAALSSAAERGGSSVLGCSPFGSQRAVSAPRSNAAGPGSGSQEAFVVRQGLQGEHGSLAKFGAVSGFFLAPPRKPNPGIERTSNGVPPLAAAHAER